MWDNKYDPPESIFDSIEPVACIVLIVATFAIISFTPLSPFSSREQSALDQLVGVNAPFVETAVAARRNAPVRMKQVEADTGGTSVVR